MTSSTLFPQLYLNVPNWSAPTTYAACHHCNMDVNNFL